MNARENKKTSEYQQDVQSANQLIADRCQQQMAMAETLLDHIESAQMHIQDLQDDISLLQTAENALDLLSENLAKIRQLTLEKKRLKQSDRILAELNDRIRNLVMVNMLIAEDTEFNGRCLFKDDIIRMKGAAGNLCLVTARLPEVNGLDNNDIHATMDSLNLAARTINRQYKRISETMRILLNDYHQLQGELGTLMRAQSKLHLGV